MQRSGMYGGELYFRGRLHDLAFIDGKTDALRSRMRELRAAGIPAMYMRTQVHGRPGGCFSITTSYHHHLVTMLERALRQQVGVCARSEWLRTNGTRHDSDIRLEVDAHLRCVESALAAGG